MKLSSQKILAGLIGVATVLTLVVSAVTPAAAQVTTTTTTTTSSSTFTRNLTIGSTGADVTALQQWLADKGFFTVTPTGYFGPITQKALAEFQASVGISPAAGYFGPITMAYIAANSGSTSMSSVPGCAAGAMFSATTGAPCTSSSSVPGCAAGAMFSATTGAPCTAGVTTLPAGCVAGSMFSSTTGVACTSTVVTGNGVLTVTQDPSVVTNTNITNYSNVPIYGLQLQAQLGSVNVSQITLAVTDLLNSGSTYENPGGFITSISVVDPSTNTVLYTTPVTPANFIVNPNNSNAFYIQLSGFNFSVPANSTKDLVVEINSASSIDLSRTLTVTGYPTGGNALQYFTGNNIVNYASLPWTTTSLFATANNTTLVFGVDSSNPPASTQYVNNSSGAQGVTLLAFNAQASSGSVNITNLTATINTNGGTAPTAVYLYNGSTLLQAVSPSTSAASTSISFNNFSDPVTSGSQKVFTIRADFPSNTSAGDIATATLNQVTYSTAGGQIIASPNQNLSGNAQTFFSASPNLTLLSSSLGSVSSNQTGQTVTIPVTFNLKVHPQPGQETQPVASNFVLYVGTSNGSGGLFLPVASTSLNNVASGGTTLASGVALPANSDATFTLTATLSPLSTPALTAGTYTIYIDGFTSTVNNISGTPITSVMATSSLTNFYSSSFTVSK